MAKNDLHTTFIKLIQRDAKETIDQIALDSGFKPNSVGRERIISALQMAFEAGVKEGVLSTSRRDGGHFCYFKAEGAI